MITNNGRSLRFKKKKREREKERGKEKYSACGGKFASSS
jgi:hypothetical protein